MNFKPQPEIQLLLHCARTAMDPERCELVHDLLRQGLDWAYLMSEATRHVVRPLVYNHLQTLSANPSTNEHLTDLHEYYCNNAARNLIMANELVRLIHLIGQNGISTVPFKGPVLAASAYDNLSFREFADLDIFVHKQDVMKIKKILLAEGYQVLLSERLEKFYLKDKYHFPFLHPETRILIEIHWTFTKRYWAFDFDHESLWGRLKPLSLAGATVWNFCPEDLILILCIHGTKHGWERLAWICDVAELIRSHEDLDWDRVLNQARKIGGLRVLHIGLFMARDLLQTNLPEQILEQINADKTARAIASNLQQQIFSGNPKMNSPYYFMQTRERLRDKTRALIYFLRISLSKVIHWHKTLSYPI